MSSPVAEVKKQEGLHGRGVCWCCLRYKLRSTLGSALRLDRPTFWKAVAAWVARHGGSSKVEGFGHHLEFLAGADSVVNQQGVQLHERFGLDGCE